MTDEQQTYGYITAVTGEGTIGKIGITEFVSAKFLNNREVTILKTEDNTNVIKINNTSDPDAENKQYLHLTDESLLALLLISILYIEAIKHPDMAVEEYCKHKLNIGDDFDFICSDNLIPLLMLKGHQFGNVEGEEEIHL